MEEKRLLGNKSDGELQLILGDMWQEVCKKGGRLNFKIISGSMNPLIREGDVVSVTKAEPARIRIGDIVAFQDGERVVVHRIFGKYRVNHQLRFLQRGDIGGHSGAISPQNLIGRVSGIKRGGREKSLDTPWYRVTGIILGWRMLFRRYFGRLRPRFLGIILHQSMKLIWITMRKIVFWRS